MSEQLHNIPKNEHSTTVTDALTAIRKKDIFDVYGRRLRGTSALVTRTGTIIGIPATAMGLLSESNTFGPQTLAVGGTATMLTGAAISSATYGVQRLTESGRARKRQEQQRISKEELGDEPVDFIRNKRSIKPWKKTNLTLRWYGADTEYQTPKDSDHVARLQNIVDFAKKHNISDVVVSAKIFELGDEKALRAAFEDNMTSTEKFFKKEKGVPITDKKADKTLARLTLEQANTLIEELKATSEISRIEALAEWILDINENHPVLKAYSDWKNLGKHKELKQGMTNIIKAGLQRHFSGEMIAEPIMVQFTTESTTEETDKDDTKENDWEIYSVRFPVDTAVMVTLHGLQISKIPRGLLEPENIKIDHVGFPQIVGSDMETFVTTLLEKRGEKVQPHERWKIELALYSILNKQSDEKTVLATTTYGEEQPVDPEKNTFYERLIDERPRTNILWPLPRKRGKVSKDKQTIRYRSAFLRNTGKKLSAAALAGALGTGAGIGWGYAWGQYDLWGNDCREQQIEKAFREYCASSDMKIANILAPKAQIIYDTNAELEEYAILKAYETGIISQTNIEQFASMVDEDWAKEKELDLSRRYNLYGGDHSYVGDVETGGQNPAVWSLTPMNGAPTEGYWTQNTQSHITVDDVGFSPLPPFSDKNIKFDNPYLINLFAPLGTKLTKEQQDEIEFIRELAVPETIAQTNKKRIGVNGRMLTGSGTLFSFATDTSDRQINWNTYSLPVLHGADIVAGHVVIKDLATDEIIAQPQGRFIQRNDGTFALLLPEDLPTGYLDIEYWIDPQAKTDLTVRAERPMTAQTVGKPPKLLTEILSETDTAKLNQELGLSPNASAEQTADAIAQSRKYNFTPYKDAEVIYDQDEKFKTNEALRIAAEYAEGLNSANCNVSTFIEMTTTRGEDEENFLNAIDGFRNDKDSILSKVESHQWTINNVGEMIDPTPSTQNAGPSPEAFVPERTSHKDLPKEIGLSILQLALLTAAGYGSVKGTRKMTGLIESNRREAFEEQLRTAYETFDGTKEEMEKDLRVLGALLYAPEHITIDEKTISIDGEGTTRTAQERLRTVPENLTPLTLHHIMQERDAEISPETKTRLMNLLTAAQKARKHQPI